MKRILLTALTTLTAIIVNAATLGMPAGELESITYRVGGGMLSYDQAYNNLAKGDDGQWVLTNKGISPGETVSIVVPDSVPERCLKIMEEQKLYLSQGTYPYDREHIVLDAPSTNFRAVFINRTPGAEKEIAFIDASGDIPKNIRNGIRVLTHYLDSFTKGIKAPGHLDRLYGDAKPTATKFSDGRDFTFDAEADDLTEFYKKCNADALNEDFYPASWSSYFYRDNDGIEYFYVSNSGIEYNNILPQVDKVPKSPMIPLIQGLYTDEAGKTYVFTREGTLKHGLDAAKEVPVTIKADKAGCEWTMAFEGKTYRFMLTDEGINLYKGTKNAKTKRITFAKTPIRLKMDVSADNEAKTPGRWHVAALYPLSMSTLQLLPRDVLTIMNYEMDARKGSRFDDNDSKAYFAGKSWYKKDSLDRKNFPLSDVEDLNMRAIWSAQKLTYKGNVPQCYCYEE